MFKLIVGLGNPGDEYRYTRHNLGRLAVQKLAQCYKTNWREEKRWQAQLATAVINGQPVILMCPSVYMNNSGIAVGAFANFYHILPNQIVVMHDELDLPPLEIRSKLTGGLNGHNGLRSVANALSNCRDFARIRLGIGRPTNKYEAIADYVLNKLSNDLYLHYQQQLELLQAQLPTWLASNGQEPIIIKP